MTAVLIQARPSGPRIRFDEPQDWGIDGGVGGWEEVPRPLKTAATKWRGRPLYTATFEMIVGDGSSSVEPERRLLERLGQQRGMPQPPQLRIRAATWPLGDRLFVLNALTRSGSDVESLRGRKGRHTRFAYTVTLLQHVEADAVVIRRAGSRSERKTKDKPREGRTYTVKAGDTLTSIAARFLGAADRWTEIRDANRKLPRDPRRLPVGFKLRIPAE